MAKVTYIGYEGSPTETSTQGYDFKRGEPTTIDDPAVLQRLNKNEFFKIEGDVPEDPAVASAAKAAAEAQALLDAKAAEEQALKDAEHATVMGRISENAKATMAGVEKAAELTAANNAKHAAQMKRIAAETRKRQGLPPIPTPDEDKAQHDAANKQDDYKA